MVTVGFHYSVDFCQLIGNPTEKYRSVKKASHTLPSVQKALTALGKWILYLPFKTYLKFGFVLTLLLTSLAEWILGSFTF